MFIVELIGFDLRILRGLRVAAKTTFGNCSNELYLAAMSGGCSLIYCFLGGLLLIPGARAMVPDVSSSPYRDITDRNIFGLKPPPPPPRPEDVKQPPPEIKLTGITSILGMKQALLKTQIPAKPPQPAREESYILTEGQSEGDIEVIAIDEKAGTVKVNNHGTPQTLDFASNGIKLPNSSTLAMAVPGAPPGQVVNLPPPAGPGGSDGRNMGTHQIPGRQVRMNNSSAGEQPTGAVDGRSGAGSSAMGNSAVNADQSGPGFTRTPDYGLTADQQAVLIEAHREELIRLGNKDEASMMPPTDFTPTEGQPLQ